MQVWLEGANLFGLGGQILYSVFTVGRPRCAFRIPLQSRVSLPFRFPHGDGGNMENFDLDAPETGHKNHGGTTVRKPVPGNTGGVH